MIKVKKIEKENSLHSAKKKNFVKYNRKCCKTDLKYPT